MTGGQQHRFNPQYRRVNAAATIRACSRRPALGASAMAKWLSRDSSRSIARMTTRTLSLVNAFAW